MELAIFKEVAFFIQKMKFTKRLHYLSNRIMRMYKCYDEDEINATVSGAVSPTRFQVIAIVEYDSDLRIESIVLKEGYTD